MNFFRQTLILCFILLTFGCTNFNNVTINANPDDVKIKSVKGSRFQMHIPVEVNNPTSNKLILKKADFFILKKGYNYAKMDLKDKVEFAANTKNNYTIVLNGRIVDPMGAVFSGFNMRSAQNEDYSISGFAKVGTTAFSKKIKFKNEKIDMLVNRISTNNK